MSDKQLNQVFGNFNRPFCCALKAGMEFPERGDDERKRTVFSQTLRDSGKLDYRVPAMGNSAGACLPGPCPTAFTKAADGALYRAKQCWRNCIRAV
jgi:hypothetical protein